ncbi:hypothetical protein BC826DRAFT_410226 [Russula brevipes]|nr:hypothetical protein BC826DRAFT_410226 [Russula brevipes]
MRGCFDRDNSAPSDKNTFRSAARPCTTAFGSWWVRRIEAGTQVQRLDHLKRTRPLLKSHHQRTDRVY